MQRDRLGDERFQAFLEVRRRAVPIDLVEDLPVAARRHGPASGPQVVARQQLAHVLEQRLAGKAELEGQVVPEAFDVGLDRGQERHERLGLAGEVQDVVHHHVMQRLDPEPVAREEQLLLRLVPDGIGVHPAQAIEARGPPLGVRAQHDLGVGALGEGSAQRRAQLGVVVDLAVVGDPAAGLVGHRLVPGLRLDDAQPPVAEPHVAALVHPDAGLVGPAMRDEVVHDLEPSPQVGDGPSLQVMYAADSAHRGSRLA